MDYFRTLEAEILSSVGYNADTADRIPDDVREKISFPLFIALQRGELEVSADLFNQLQSSGQLELNKEKPYVLIIRDKVIGYYSDEDAIDGGRAIGQWNTRFVANVFEPCKFSETKHRDPPKQSECLITHQSHEEMVYYCFSDFHEILKSNLSDKTKLEVLKRAFIRNENNLITKLNKGW